MGGGDVLHCAAHAAADMAVGRDVTIVAAVAATQFETEDFAVLSHAGEDAVDGGTADGRVVLVDAVIDRGGGGMSATAPQRRQRMWLWGEVSPS